MILHRLFHLPGVGPVARKAARRRLRRIMRGHLYLRRDGKGQLIVDLMAALTHKKVAPGSAFKWLLGAAHTHYELAVRQYLLRRVRGTIALNTSVLAALGSRDGVVHPLPKEWRDEIRAMNVPVAGFRSLCLWWAYVCLFWGHGVMTMMRTGFRSVYASIAPVSVAGVGCTHFVGLARHNLPQPGVDGLSHDILSWYWAWPGRDSRVTELTHTVDPGCHSAFPPNRFVPTELSPVPLSRLPMFLGWCTIAAAYSLFGILRGRWGNAVMLGELVLAQHVRMLPVENLASEYMFHSSDVAYRPLWTYEAEAKGSLVTMYCYSTNNEPFTQVNGQQSPLHTWQVMSWKRVLVWDNWQAAFMRHCLGPRAHSVEVMEVGPIWFHSSPVELPPVGSEAVAVFDVQPQRTSRRQSLAIPHEYYSPSTAKAFLLDILTVAAEFGRPVIFKRKRRAGPIVHRGYARLVDHLATTKRLTAIDPDISAVRVIESSALVISMPFTSTALIGLAQGRPSIYYDPLGLVQPDDRAAHGIPIISGVQSLRQWFEMSQTVSEPDSPI